MEYRLELKNVSKSFGEVQALENINFQLGRNEIVGLLGDNGAGKSTLIKIITGYYQPTSGEIYFNGKKVDHLSVPKPENWAWKPYIRNVRWLSCKRSGAISFWDANSATPWVSSISNG